VGGGGGWERYMNSFVRQIDRERSLKEMKTRAAFARAGHARVTLAREQKRDGDANLQRGTSSTGP
jgi:ribosomal protein S21